jgi:4-cresol dehydrogenase (hydroxylating) flavoprotein subunit
VTVASTAQQIRSAIDGWRRALGAEQVIVDGSAISELLNNASGLNKPEVPAYLKARTVEDVQAVLTVAREHKVPVYPISTGKNWGLGSRIPPRAPCALLDLSALNRIREVHEKLHYAVIEPGVTQQQLADYLRERGLPLIINLTGSSPNSSVLANALERGTGFHRQRTDECRGLEVVLSDAEVVRTGFWAERTATEPHFYRHGMGPTLDGIFTQSNFGVVTAMILDLIPRPPRIALMCFAFNDDALAVVIDRLRTLYDQGILRWIAHVFNDARMNTMNTSKNPPWLAISAVMGDEDQLAYYRAQLEAKLLPLGTSLAFIGEGQVDVEGADPMITAMYDVHRGKPTWGFLHGLYHTITGAVPENYDELDQTTFGMLACLPVLPMLGETVVALRATITAICEAHSLHPAITFNPLDSTSLETVANIYFDRRDPDAVSRAHACQNELHRTLYAQGVRFYRTDVSSMDFLTDRPTGHQRTIHKIGLALDPEGIIAPGRYRPAGP